MAEAIFRKKLADLGISHIEVQSAGVAAPEGSPASHGAIEVLRLRDIKADRHRSRMFTESLGQWADLILTMTASHKVLLGDRFPQFLDKMFTLKEYVGNASDHDISDPYGGNLQVYEQAAAEIEREVMKLVEIIKQR